MASEFTFEDLAGGEPSIVVGPVPEGAELVLGVRRHLPDGRIEHLAIEDDPRDPRGDDEEG